MNIEQLHSWELSPPAARALQATLRRRVVASPLAARPRLVAGVDVAFAGGGTVAVAAAAVVSLPSLEVVEHRFATAPVRVPYIPGLLSFREGEAALAAIGALEAEPDLFIFDGQGICHPRRFGLASHLGVLLGKPSVGCAKSLLVGTHTEPAAARGSRRRIVHRGESLGAALRTRAGVRPVYVSVGHLVDLPGALRAVLACARRYRLPEPQRAAHRLVTEESRKLRAAAC